MRTRIQCRSIGERRASSASSRSASAATFGPLLEAEVPHNGFARVVGVEGRSHRDVPRGPEDAERPRDRHGPLGRPFASAKSRPGHREVAQRRCGGRAERPAGAARLDRLPRRSARRRQEPSREEQDERISSQSGGIQEEEAHEEGNGAADPRGALPGGGRTPKAVLQLEGGGDEQQRADPWLGRSRSPRSEQGEDAHHRREDGETVAAHRAFGHLRGLPGHLSTTDPGRRTSCRRRGRGHRVAARRRDEEELLSRPVRKVLGTRGAGRDSS